ncbi:MULTISPECIES: hypothetical protein [unclassified Polaromonas]|uniref:hypothetical protein n=1 Tax=unclassified Polaromonas TaxID=2638319 RepID=UPI000F089E81|nr:MULTISPECIES: hypothetical protein [unclassified Polaromonas]AYQ29291.1 hypothetical protein DT070_15440 [Polaromonas sp. SP1]QGJ19595.1 hypothetical protein F7R28_15155 [Polaromonas sp. Pch-P]
MSFWIEGWVEVACSVDTPEKNAWAGLIRLGPLIDTYDEVSEELFCLSKRVVTGEVQIRALAPLRGIPDDASTSVKYDLAGIADHEEQFGTGEFGGYTHATWRDMKTHPLTSEVAPHTEWSTVFDLLRTLERSGKYNDEGIRIVVWYNW